MPYHLHHAKRIIDTFKSDAELAQIKIIVAGQIQSLLAKIRKQNNELNQALKAAAWLLP